MTVAFPLQWPDGFARSTRRENGQFKTSFDKALANVIRSLKLFAADSGKPLVTPVLSSNIDPNPLADKKPPTDPGVSVWFTWDGMPVCIPVDRYTTPAANLQAIHHILEARRTELRHGTLALVRATFQGFRALPAPDSIHWADVLKVPKDAARNDVEAAYRRLANERHPDKGGSDAMMAELNAARARALKECRP